MSAFVYILRCADGSYYVGSTRKSLEERIASILMDRFAVTRGRAVPSFWSGRRRSSGSRMRSLWSGA
ncbi:GIY-YIG nuclease family protein [Pelagibius sp.]|uniref:GIY-YIG nuclease family protein n=1 Tax=Pelagibius sp. TaxID=1931238 RepID=UPI003BA9CD64